MPLALLVDDDPNVLLPFADLVAREGFDTEVASSLADARELLRQRSPDVLLVDLLLPDGNGMDLLSEVEAGTQVVLITAHATVDTAVEALRLGACDYLTKPIDVPRLKAVLGHLFQARRWAEEIGSLRGELRRLGRFGCMVGGSAPMQRLYDLIGRVAPTNATVLLTGESGAGKELVAQTLHDLSRRKKDPFFPLNCGAVSPHLIESELFGHERGSFTGADRLHKGYFERAHGGTLFLDEVTEMPIELQVKLLRVLETGAVMRIGGERPIEVDVRVIAATNRDPEQAVTEQKLREDLLYRLRVFPLEVPPLRERDEDIEMLAQFFLDQLNKSEGTKKVFTRAALKRLRQHEWPGNVRELKNLVHHAFILADEEIGPESVRLGGDPPVERPAPRRIVEPAPATTPAAEVGEAADATGVHLHVGVSIAEADRRLLLTTLERFGGDKRKTAAVLGVSLKTVYNRLNEYRRT
jgi:two-component system, NtrC family, response regulator AtoC